MATYSAPGRIAGAVAQAAVARRARAAQARVMGMKSSPGSIIEVAQGRVDFLGWGKAAADDARIFVR